jgi:hypothetical protein
MKKQVIASLLANGYTKEPIDGEICLYRDYKNGYDVEVSRAFNRRKTVCIYVWHNKNNIVERYFDIPVGEMTLLLEDIRSRYEGK